MFVYYIYLFIWLMLSSITKTKTLIKFLREYMEWKKKNISNKKSC